MTQQFQQSAQEVITNNGYQNATSLQIRLDTNPLLDQLELFLRGSRLIVEEQDGEMVTKRISVGKAKCNDEGIQSILAFISSIINTQVVQGNFSEDRWASYNRQIWENLTDIIVINCYNWEIDDDDIDHIIDTTTQLVQPFTSRLILNKERESYAQTIQSTENTTVQEKSKGLFKD